jgi:pimeloyl-ACP methyl ester carboxylesterase
MIPTVALVLALLSPFHTVTAEGCPDIHVVGARGSGQQGYGEQVGGIVKGIVADAERDGLDVDDVVLDYPAISLAESFGFALFTGEYDRSVETGVDALTAELDALRATCPTTRVILIGYSQGAQVIKQTMLARPPVDRIESVILLGDPTRDVLQVGLARFGDVMILNPGSLGAVDIASHIRPISIDVFALNDSVCSGAGINFQGHLDGYADTYAEIGPLLAQRLNGLVPRYRSFL